MRQGPQIDRLHSLWRRDNRTKSPYNPWRYAAKRYDPELNLSYFGRRDYDPKAGRWITTDPAKYIDGTNLYAYLHNDPLNNYDPNGEFAIALFGISLGASGGAAAAILSNPIGWTVGGLLVATASIYWATGKLTSTGHISQSTGNAINTAIGGLAGSMINSFDYPSLGTSMPQTFSSRYGNVIVKNDQTSQNDHKNPPRTEPKDLAEQLTLEEAEKNEGKQIMQDKIKDSKYPKEDWEKKQYNHKSLDGVTTEIHYWEKIKTRERTGFKFKDYK